MAIAQLGFLLWSAIVVGLGSFLFYFRTFLYASVVTFPVSMRFLIELNCIPAPNHAGDI
jgi:hypothetical protein